MSTSQIESEKRVTELATQALMAFCDDISVTFGVDMECRQQAIAAETVAGLRKRFKKLVAVNIIDSQGIPDGTFRFIFDQEGIFTLGGIIAMLPEQRIMSNRQHASAGLAESMIDAMGEAGNLLVGSWDRVFSNGGSQSASTHRLPAFVGKPWDKSEETMGLAGDEEVIFIPYEMTVGSYQSFSCGVILPKTIFNEGSDFTMEQAVTIEQDTTEEIEEKTKDMQTATETSDSEEADKEPDMIERNDGEESQQEQPSIEETPAEITDAEEVQQQAEIEQVPEDTAEAENAAGEQSNTEEPQYEQPSVEETPAETTDAGEVQQQAETGQVPEDTAEAENVAAEQSNVEESQLRQPDISPEKQETAPDTNAADKVDENTAAAPRAGGAPARGKIFEAIRKITQSPAILPGQSAMAKKEIPRVTGDLFDIRANDIMQNKVTWASSDHSLQQALTKMRQTDAGYIMVGQNGVLEGIVSQSDIARAMSPYLQPIFSKWRRPLDDATLKIRIKWIMSRPVRTIKPETSLAAIMEYMNQFRGRCLPVTDEAGNVQGLVTAFDIFQALLKSGSNTPAQDPTARALVESAGVSRTE